MKNNINKCPVSKYCGGCQFQGFSYSKQLEIKQQEIDKLLSSFHPVNKIIGMDNPDNYRNKVQINFCLSLESLLQVFIKSIKADRDSLQYDENTIRNI